MEEASSKNAEWIAISMADRLEREFASNLASLSRKQIMIEVTESIAAAEAVGIVSSSLVYRFLRLRYYEPERWTRIGTAELVYDVLTNDLLAAEERICFLEKVVFGMCAP